MTCACLTKKYKIFPAPLLIDSDVLLHVLQSLSALMSFFTTGGMNILPSQTILSDEIILKILIC